MIVTSSQIMQHGLVCMNFEVEKQLIRSHEANWDKFKQHYGVTPRVAATVWNDLCTTDIENAKLEDGEKRAKGLSFFLMALHFLWANPKNRHLLASRFQVCDKLASGKALWKWVFRVSALQAKVIVWPQETFSDPNGPRFIITVDCRDHKCWEKKHHRYNLDPGYASKKHGKHAALKYELALSVYTDQIVWMNGPFKATRHDLTIFREDGLKEKVLALGQNPRKFVICDLGYRSSEKDEMLLAVPSSRDRPKLKKFKSLARCRQEDMNGRMAKFKILSDEFTYSVEKFAGCYEAIAVLLQYSINVGDACLPIVQV